ncbi:MAG: GGDEF domain-containing protein [Lachnospiraceae bacterium]|nr:GGDEF domain-containing protein [Lachnospiraceae bacterium]
MFKKNGKDSIYINSFENSKEVIANRYALKCLTCAMIVIFAILILNLLNIFLINRTVTVYCFILCLLVYGLTMLVRIFGDLSKEWVKYYILFGLVVWITIVSTSLTYHALLACALPLISSSIYSSKKVTIYTYTLMVISTVISVFVGYHLGICDANMVLLTGEPMSKYLTDANEFTLNMVNNQIVWSLSLFFVLPRSMILLAFAVVSSSVSKILNVNMDYARKMENMAEIDGMTGLYNRSKYISMMSESYLKEEQVGVIFWDINFLKKTNDTRGHEAGDELILTVAHSIERHMTDKDLAYRIGGDEFIMVMQGADNKYINKKLQDWNKTLAKLQQKVDINLSVAVGYSSGKGENFDSIIREADRMMYENKNKMHEQLEG